MVAGACAGDVQQVSLGVVDILEVGLVGDLHQARVQRDHVVVAGDDRDGSELQTFGGVHRADADVSVGEFHALFDPCGLQAGRPCGSGGPVDLFGRADEDADFVRHDSFQLHLC